MDTLYIADYLNNRVQRYLLDSSNGATIAGQANGVIGSTATDFHYPTDAVIDSSGNLYVTDRYNNRVQLWSSGASIGKTIAGTGT